MAMFRGKRMARIGDMIGPVKGVHDRMVNLRMRSAMTAAAPTVAVLLAPRRSVLEGIGAALVLPALAALVAGTIPGPRSGGAYLR